MTASLSESPLMATANLLTYYNFQDETQTQDELLNRWLHSYPERWVRLALIEALYQGRYKSVSVEFLLQLWQRRGQPIYHFNSEFAALVCHNVPQTFLSLKQQPKTASTLEMPVISAAKMLQRSGAEQTVSSNPASQTTPTHPDAIARSDAERPSTSSDDSMTVENSQPITVGHPSEVAPQTSADAAASASPSKVEEKVQLSLDDATDDDWLTAELEMAAVENVQALVKQVSQKTDRTTSPIHHFMPVVQESTGLYSRLAAIANTRTYSNQGTD